jgi:hypothetical protein
MTDAAPEILYSVNRSGDPIAIIERKIEGGQQEVLDHYPGMITGELTTDLAKMVNHFAREFQYEVIEDPAAFAAAYRAQIAAEDPDANWQQGNPRLRDFGMPDLDAITPPVLNGQKLVYFAKSVRLGVPYRVDVDIDGTTIGKAQYEPMKMGPIK